MHLLVWFNILASIGFTFADEEEKRDNRIAGNLLEERSNTSNCGTDSSWAPTPAAYIAANTDSNLLSWWTNISSSPSHNPLPNELAQLFGAHQYQFSCGIGDDSSCSVDGCQDFSTNGDPAWSYLALESISQLNDLFNAMYTGVLGGQTDYEGLIGNISEDFFTWGDGQAHESSSASWGSWAASTFGGDIVGTAVSGIVDNTETKVASGLTESEGVAVLGEDAVSAAQQLREWIQNWANTTFNGDQNGGFGMLLDYLKKGSALSLIMPTAMEAELFYKRVFLSKTITESWVQNRTFVLSALTDDPNDASGPNITKYYSAAQGRVYYLYTYHTTGRLSGNLDAPRGLYMLNDSRYGIDSKDITKSSAVNWEAGSPNSTVGLNGTVSFVSGNDSDNPFSVSGAWEGLWTVPVCDIGRNIGWNAQYGKGQRPRYGSLPCCCGTNCSDTKAFIQSVSMTGLQTLLVGCKGQLANSNVSAENRNVDYGFKLKLNFRQKWDSWSVGVRAGVGIGMTLACLSPIWVPMTIVACSEICS